MPKLITQKVNPDELHQAIDRLRDRYGSYRAMGRVLGIDHSYLWRLRRENRRPAEEVLRKLKLREVIRYEPVGPPDRRE